MREDRLKQILNTTNSERDILGLLSTYPEIIRWAVCRTGGHSTYVVKEFPFGSKYRADFVVAMSYSFGWEVNFIEIEPPNDMVITKQGLPSNKMNSAISQINDWKLYVEQNPGMIRRELADYCANKDLLKLEWNPDDPSNFTGNYLRSPETFIRFNYFIFIGNREKITNRVRQKMNGLTTFGVEIFSCTRLLDIAKNIDYSETHPYESVNIREAKDYDNL